MHLEQVEVAELGCARLEPSSPVLAGSTGTWTLVYTVGSLGIDEGGTIKVTRRFASDWEEPQFDAPLRSGYTTVATNGLATITPRYERKGHTRPYMKALILDVSHDALKPGEEVVIVFGDRREGSPGMRAQTFQESAHEFRVFVDPTNAVLARPLANSPTLKVVAGPASGVVCLLPTQCLINEWVEVLLRGEDAWGNPTGLPEAQLSWEGEGEAEIVGTRMRLCSRGTGWLMVKTELGLFRSNPMTSRETSPRFRQFWGDLHAQTGTTIGTGTDHEYFTFGRDAARLDVIGHQGNDFQMSDPLWDALNQTTTRFNQEGRYIVLPGYEWSGNTPCGGDHNVFYLEEGLPILRSSHWQVPEATANALTPAHPLETLFDKMRQSVPQEKVVIASHVGGRYADMRRPIDDTLAPLVEIVSCWGIFEWMLWDSFEYGHTVGVMANSDGHKGRPGAEGPGAGEFGIANGLTCILARALTRHEIFDALKNRRCYATTGARIDLRFVVNDAPMGSIIPPAREYQVNAGVTTVAPLEELAIYAGCERVHIYRPPEFRTASVSRRVRVQWGGAASRGRSRRIHWEGVVHLDGNQICGVPFAAFDSPADGIELHGKQRVNFRSCTTGDTDFFDLDLEHAAEGHLCLETNRGSCRIALADLGATPLRQECGGLDAYISLARYPARVTTRRAHLQVNLPASITADRPIFIRALQTDGQMAWSSPIYPKAAGSLLRS